ncbi:MAG: hypothetical protein JO020_20210 [Chloroflexi bacterium]|nr:hypothetical protein [Chloroflexota bacterium]
MLTYFDAPSNWGRWGTDDELGTLNLPEDLEAAEARQGVRPLCSAPSWWEFLFVIAPWRWRNATASPATPLAIL